MLVPYLLWLLGLIVKIFVISFLLLVAALIFKARYMKSQFDIYEFDEDSKSGIETICLFCQVAMSKKVTKILETDRCIVISDLRPRSERHFLVIPKRHIKNIWHLRSGDDELIEHMVETVKKVMP